MREIKFRGKHLGNGQWMFGSLIIGKDGSTYIHTGGRNKTAIIKVITDTVGQYAGLKDKNGKDIYEGDIVNAGKGSANYEVIWGKTGFSGLSKEGDDWGPYTLKLYINDGKPELTVIGNIYETPELLTSK